MVMLLFTLLNLSTYFVGLSKTPPGAVFTGAVHYQPDYFYYLSFIAQGATRWLTNFHLFTAETTVPELIGWYYTLSGRLLLPLFRSPVVIYQILTAAGSLLYLGAAYLLIKKLFPQHRTLQLLVLVLFLTSCPLPQITVSHGHWTYSHISAWYNFGDPFERLTNIPHHLLAAAAGMLACILAFDWWKGKRGLLRTIAFFLIGIILASIQPMLWLEISMVLGVIGYKRSFIPALIVAGSGLPFILYLKFYLYSTPPYSTAVLWEPSVQLITTFKDYMILNGLLVPTAILGLPVWLRSMTREKCTLTLLTALSLLLFFSPIPKYLHILNIRFLSVCPTLFFASVTGELFRKFRMSSVFLCAILIGVTIPINRELLTTRHSLFTPGNMWVYLPADVIAAYTAAAKQSRPDDMFLVPSPLDASFPGYTGRRIFTSYSNVLWRVNYNAKQKLVDTLYNVSAPDTEKNALLRQANIKYILRYSWDPPLSGDLLPAYKNNTITIYKVLLQ